ncbi:HD domain-containing phosphohydrolase [Cellulosilyticum sp. I15G10I2]|uniref:HD domain-containing phosphohydrolase n=1 Tax=Cellulosilyticum sp. I15G10I2 TaxID=1892843 RepID=UPI00085CAD72|nr:HD domain-containing phosphohydrolase [Cellulosilyticum sp. I15G10I2]
MNQMIKRFYSVGIIVAITVALGMFLEYSLFEKVIKEELQTNISLKRDNVAGVISGRLRQKGQMIADAAVFIATQKEDENILLLLKKLMADNPSFSSIYFGTPKNKMVNGSGWMPPPTFDLRTRPWYKKAIQEDGLIYTEAFLNASNDHYVVTVAQPVYDLDNQFLGVVAGDISIEGILNLIEDQKISDYGYSFLIDGKGNILAHPSKAYVSTAEPINIKAVSEGLAAAMFQNKADIMPITLEGIRGYAAYQPIAGTDWMVGSFVPMHDYINTEKQILMIFLITGISASLIFSILVIQQRKHIIMPILAFDKDIRLISVDKNINYRLPIETKDPFRILRASINAALEKTQDYFGRLNENQEELKASNEELTAALQQLMATEMELRESEEKNKAIVNALPDIIFRLNQEGRFLDCQVGDETRLVYEKKDFLGKLLIDVMPEPIATKGIKYIVRALEENKLQIFEYSIDFPDGINHYEMRIVKIKGDEVMAITRDITDQKKNLSYIEYLSYHDQLTGLYNRRFLEEMLISLDETHQLPLTIAMIDVNGLKLTNDAFGHVAGDELLKKVSEIFTKECRAEDVVARVGGDEFIILFPRTTYEEAEKVVKNIYSSVSNERIRQIMISVSIGWETKYEVDQPINDIFSKAEEYMYRKKLTESQSMRNETIRIIINTLNEKNEREKIHSEKVSLLSKQIGIAMQLDYEVIKEIEAAGLMHDIGKIAINENVLNKPEVLTETEYDDVKKHSEIGYQILKSVDTYSSLAESVLSHHERWDGQGYPRGLRGKDIPLIARIIAVADAYEAMVSDRPYRKGVSREVAIKELIKHAGTQFDPEITGIFTTLIQSDDRCLTVK